MGPLISRATGKQARVVALKTNKDLDYMNDLFQKGGLKLLIDRPYSLGDVPQAIQRFGEARHIGKVVISVATSAISLESGVT
jgi:NADPH:quinone reductase-like Zn-dependent oxidoreductase